MTDLAALEFVDAPPVPEHLNVLAYGAPGSGKSTFAATAPGPILWLNLEGPGALAYARKTAHTRSTQILEVRVDDGEDPRPTMDLIYAHVKQHKDPAPVTVVIDTIGKLREALIKVMVQQGSAKSLQQFGDVARKLGGFIVALRDLPVNLVLLAHEDVDSDEESGRIVRPLIGGKLTEQVSGEVDIVTYTGVVKQDDDVRYFGQLVEGRGRRAKDRSGGLGPARELDLTEWITTYRASLAPDGPPVPWEGDGTPDTPDIPDHEPSDENQLGLEGAA